MSATGILQAAIVIPLTVPVPLGLEVGTENAEYLQLYITYANGDETGYDPGIRAPYSRWSKSPIYLLDRSCGRLYSRG